MAYLDGRPRPQFGGIANHPTATALLVVAGLVAATTPFDRALGLDIQFLRSPSAALGLVLVILFLWLTKGRIWLTHRSQIWAVAFAFVMGVLELARLAFSDSHTYVGVPSLSLFAALYMSWVQPIVLFFIVAVLARDRRSVALILQGFPFVMGALALGAIAVAGASRWAPLGLNENAAGLAFGMAMVIATAVLLRSSPHLVPALAIAYAVCVPLNLIGLLGTGSRGASAATLVALAALVVLTPMKLRRLLMLLAALLVLSVPSGQYLQGASSILLDRWESALEGTQLGARDELIAVSYSLFVESPIWGYGLQVNRLVGERYWAARGSFSDSSFAPHNTLFALLLPVGLVGAFPWFGMVLAVTIGAWKHRRHPNAPMLLALLVLFFVYTVGGSIVGNKLFYVVLGLAAGLPFWDGRREGVSSTGSPSMGGHRPVDRLLGQSPLPISGQTERHAGAL